MRLERKFESWCWFLLRILPILFLVVSLFSIRLTDLGHFDIYQLVFEFFIDLPIMEDVMLPITDLLNSVFHFSDVGQNYMVLVLGLFSYWLFIEIFRFIFDMFTILFKIARNLMNRLVGHNEKN